MASRYLKMDTSEEIRALIDQLQDPARRNRALLALLCKGQDSVPPLVEFLRSSKPSAVAEARLLAVEGLSILGGPDALEALIEVAKKPLPEINSPVVRLAEEIVVSRAALALADFTTLRAGEALLKLLEGKPLLGVAEAFEKLRDTRALPILVSWLEDDFVAQAASRAILAYGRTAVPALLASVRETHTRDGSETAISQRRRARIVELLASLGEPDELILIENLLDDSFEAVRWNAVRALLSRGNSVQQRRAFQVGLHLLDSADGRVRADCEELLTSRLSLGSDLIEEEIKRRRIMGESVGGVWPRETTLEILVRILRKRKNSDQVNQ